MKFKKIIASALSVSILVSSAGMSIGSFAAGRENRMKQFKVHLKAATIESDVENTKRKAAEKRFKSKASNESSPYIISFTGPITEEMKDMVTDVGVTLLDYIPKFSFLAFMHPDTVEKVNEFECVGDVIPYLDEYKIDPELMEEINNSNEKELEEEVDVAISTFDIDCSDVIKEINKDGISKVKKKSQLKKVKVKRKSLIDISKVKSVKFIEKAYELKINNDIARGIMGFESAESMAYEGEGQTVCVADTGLDKGNPGLKNNTLHSDFTGRVIKIIDENGEDGADRNGHGTHVSGSVLGSGQISGGKIKGTASKANLIMQDIGPGAEGYVNYPDTLYNLLEEAYTNGARIHTNSWGSKAEGSYTERSAEVDKFLWEHKDMTILFSSGNEGRNGPGTVGSPATAKNCITVGASESFRPYIEFQNGLSMSDNPDERALFSSYGCKDGRIKPDVVAPGSFISSTKSGMLGDEGNKGYTYMSGTSMSTPLTAGTVAVIREFLQKRKGITNPSAALIKSLIINGSLTNGYSYEKGWGKVSIYDSLYSTKIIDQNSSLITGKNKRYQSGCYVKNSDKPLKITLVWTDYPGTSTAPSALVNDLDLKVTSPDGTVVYNGNDFTAPYNSEVDRLNNVENVIINNPAKGMYKIEVSGYSVSKGPQPFALVASYDFFSTPKNLKASSSTNSINVSWDAVPGATGYDISVDGTIISLTGTNYNHENLQYNKQHLYKVRAKNSVKTGDWSNTITTSTVLDNPVVKADVTTSKINLKWQPVNEATFYDVYFEGGLMLQTVNTNYSFTSIEPKTQYNFFVRARTTNNASEPSNKIAINTLDCGLETKASMKEARMDFAALAATSGKVYVFGGNNDSETYLNTVEEYDPENDIWTSKQSMSIARTGMAAVEASNGKIYVIGGYNGSYLNTVEEYDPLTGLWTKKTPMTTARSGLGAVFADGKIYTIGGNNGKPLNIVEIYDPVNDTWSSGKQMPTARSNFGISVKDGSVFVLGGVNGTTNLNSVEEYNLSLDQWTVRKDLNKWNSDFSLSQINGILISAGGKNSDKIEEYNPETGLIAERISLPTQLYGHTSVVLKGKLLIIGGNNGMAYQNKVFSYNTDEGKWAKKADMNYQKSFFASAALNGKIYTFGGFGGQNYEFKDLDKVEEYDPSTDKWTLCPSIPDVRVNAAAAAVNEKIYLCGGSNSHLGASEFYDTLYEYDPIKKVWTTKSKMPERRYMHQAVSLNGYIYVVGGIKAVYNAENEFYERSMGGNVLRYDPVNDKWETLAAMNIPRNNHCVGVANGKIYALGGQDERNEDNILDSIEEYDPSANKWTIKNPMPDKELQFGTFSLNNKIYVVGSKSENLREYDPATETWVRKGSFAYNNAYRHRIEYADNKVFALGGLYYFDIAIALDNVYSSDDFLTSLTIGNSVMEPRAGRKSIPLTINNVPTDGIYNAEAEVSYDPAKLTVSNITAGNAISEGCHLTYTVDSIIGRIKVIFTGDMVFQKLIKTNGIFANIEFDVFDSVNVIGSTPLTLERSGCKLYKSPDFQYDGLKLNNGSVDIFIYGDVNGDSTVSMNDTETFRSYMLGSNSGFTYQYGQLAADVDGNGLVNGLDMGHILMFAQGKISKFPVQQ
ncbi:Kelch repeat-containing protein [Pseudobacteroides cellulosolvens]|uniref:Peptidase S8 and S53 subtilisin kexin sedolisin n=1 Tax=Pseudobacteroides cellulosolvens ATCC 35603 = DSM 2933 TaxID=398512 RepID=A0A0L6JV62_9FIRM|nr:kelch repeat-containing protein [Pseudobacteroides cellulosolvens]KNY29731.1 peptidase S8 and S53 subtilisin kexin sedolisin [Pseudobacteroides cellulosolvens ATCC 35603 = DSM 2933]